MRLIDADALIDNIKSEFEGAANLMASSGALFAVMALKSAPTLELDNLRPKGRWVKKPWKVLGCVLRYDTVCSECGFDAPTFADGGCSTVLTKFCHNCGAKMENGE